MHDTDIDLHMINGDVSHDSQNQVAHARELTEFAAALASTDEEALCRTREALLQVAGSDTLVDAACVAGNFQRMVRIADAIGIPIDAAALPLMTKAADELNLRRFASAQNTPPLNFFQRLIAPVMSKLAVTMMRRMGRRASD